MATIGLIAGGGRFPLLFAECARRAGHRGVAAAHLNQTDPALEKLVDGVTGKRTRSTQVQEAVESGLQALLMEHAESAAEAAARSWGSTEAGRTLLASTRGLDRASRDIRVTSERLVRDWQAGVLEMVRTEGADKRLTAKVLAFGVNGVGVALMITVFVHSAGVTGTAAGRATGA